MDKSFLKIQEKANQYLNQKGQFPAPPQSIEQSVNAMPNAEKLTPSEHWIYGKLPGFSQGNIGQALEWFGNTGFGKALSKLDVLAEGAERFSGLVQQMSDDPTFDLKDLQAGWYAGSLFGDVNNLPALKRDEAGKIIGMTMPHDLPGTYGLTKARNFIAQAIANGADPGQALIQARDSYYNDLGALALRAQMHDTYFHIFADPLNYLLPALKPVERTVALAKQAASTKSIYTLSQLQDLEKVAQATGRTEEAAQWAAQAAKVQSGEVKTLSTVDRMALFLTGAGELQPTNKLRETLKKIPVLGLIPKAFELTPESKARELALIMDDNLNTNIVSRVFNLPDAEDQFMSGLNRVTQSATGDWGHAMTTLEGRTAHAYTAGARNAVQPIYEAYKEVEPQRNLLNTLSRTLGMEDGDFLKLASNEPENLIRMLAQKPELQPLLQAGQITPDSLNVLAKVLKDVPYNKEMFFAEAMGAVADQAMRQAIAQFGVKARGPFMRWIGAIKTAENLAFLRSGNFGYVARNFLNNEFTMLGRGVFGTMSGDDVRKFWKEEGFIPKRLGDDLTIADAEEFAKGAESVLKDALRGGNYGAPEKIEDFVRKLSFGKLDTGRWSRDIERSARMRSFTIGYNQYWDNYYKPTAMSKVLSGTDFEALRRADPDIAEIIDSAIRSARGSEARLDAVMKSNLHLNTQAVLDEVSRSLGQKAEDVLDTEILTHIHKNLPEALKTGRVQEFVTKTRAMIENHLEDLFQKQVQNIVADTTERVKLGGPKAYTDAFDELQNVFWSAHTEHAIRTPEAARLAREASSAGDFTRARSLWEKNFADEDRFFDRAFRRYQAVLDGLNQGAKELRKQGYSVPLFDEAQALFKDWRKGWKEFFDFKRRGTSAWADGKQDWKAFSAEKSRRYREMVAKETELMRKMDESIAAQLPGPFKETYTKGRKLAEDLRIADKEAVIALFEKQEAASKDEWARLLDEFWKDRKLRYEEMWQVDRATIAASQGDPMAAQYLDEVEMPKADVSETPPSETPLADEYLFDKGPQRPFIADVEGILPKQPDIQLGEDLTAYGRQYSFLDEIVDASKRQAEKKPLILDKLPENLQKKVLGYIETAKNDMSAHRYAATRFAEFRSDSALLNYNRRTNFDTWVSSVFPYAFWTTGSMAKWAIHSIDRPAMFTTYLRMKKFLETSGVSQEGLPSRVRGKIRVKLPFAPAWMGDQFIDPLSLLLPFDTFAQPYEQFQTSQIKLEGRAERLLEDMAANGEITDAEYQEAVNSQSGPTWDLAVSRAQGNDESLKFDAWDFASLMSSPHAPIAWAYNAAMGHPEDIGPFTPLSRTFRNVATVLGVDDWANSDWNVEAKVRRQLGLPAFDKWDDYRIDRSLSNLAASGQYSYDDISRAMALSSAIQSGQITREEAMQDPAWETYQAGVTQSNQEYAGGPSAVLMKLLGIPVSSYPEGEKAQRALQDDFGRAYQAYQKGDVEALTDFFDAHPEYESRLALFKKPEERMKNFLIDEVWSRWNQMPKVNRDEVREQMGDTFNQAFLDKDTRSYDDIDPVQLQIWLKLMGGNPIGTMTADQKMLLEFNQLKLTDPETAYRAQVFYDKRNQDFPGWFEAQNAYYTKGPSYRKPTPFLRSYWDWRRGFMQDNPDLVPYLTDDQKAIDRAAQQTRVPEVAVPSAEEIRANLSPAMQGLLAEAAQGQDLPYEASEQIEVLAEMYGLTTQQMYGILGLAQ